jgi:LysR family transcriptional regulator, transcriptional activator of nhaA
VHTLNYQHLFYFWHAVREGSVTAAARKLSLAQPTLSAQIRQLEERLGGKLFQTRGRARVPTELGRTAFGYADSIFALGGELVSVAAGEHVQEGRRLVVGVVDVLPKLAVYRMLAPALARKEVSGVVCNENRLEQLLAGLATEEIDLVLSDTPNVAFAQARTHNHLLGESGTSFFATRAVARRLARGFPRTLAGQPFLLPGEGTSLRRGLERWFDEHGVQPVVVGEFVDSALLQAFGQAGVGVFAAPTAIEAEIRRQWGVSVVGRADSVRERYYAINLERRRVHPGVLAVVEAARRLLEHRT